MADIKKTISGCTDKELEDKEAKVPSAVTALPTKAKIDEVRKLLQEQDKNGGSEGIAETTKVAAFHVKTIRREMRLERQRRSGNA